MKLKYKRSLKTASLSDIRKNNKLEDTLLFNRNHVWFVWVCMRFG